MGETDKSTLPTLSDAAIAYAEAGWPIFPLRGKNPLPGSRGFKDATTDLDRVRRWWKGRPEANIGTAIPDSMAVVDVDPKHGGLDTLRRLEDRHGIFETLTVLTGGGGLHLYFIHPGGDLRQGVGILGDGIDTRIPGKGYAVLPPSVHPDTGALYEWHPVRATAAPMPRWMIDRLRPEPPRRASSGWRASSGDLDGRLRGVLSVVTPDGPEWNERLHWAACRAGEMVAEGADRTRLEQLLLDAAGPWNDREARAALATIRSGMRRTGSTA